MVAIRLRVNGRSYELECDPDTPLLWALRDHLGLTGTKFACGVGLCGACTVHRAGRAIRSCVVPLESVADDDITTIEGVTPSHPVLEAWLAEQVPQCGYCQPGVIMAVTALLAERPDPSDAEVAARITNLCRCGTQPRILRAIRRCRVG